MTIILLCSFVTLYSQSKFNEGFSDGYKKGFCQDKGIGCLAPIPPFSPLPQIGEDINNYQDGYNRGFTEGLKDSKLGNNNSNNDNRVRYKTSPSEPIDYMYKESDIVTNLKIQLYHRLFPEMIDDFKNSNYTKVIEKGNSLLKLKLGTMDVYEIMGASYCNLNDGKSAKFYLKKAIKLGSNNAKSMMQGCVK